MKKNIYHFLTIVLVCFTSNEILAQSSNNLVELSSDYDKCLNESGDGKV
jgi:hypothetical protein